MLTRKMDTRKLENISKATQLVFDVGYEIRHLTLSAVLFTSKWES